VESAAARPHEGTVRQREVLPEPRDRIVARIEIAGIDMNHEVGVTQTNADIPTGLHVRDGRLKRHRRLRRPGLVQGLLADALAVLSDVARAVQGDELVVCRAVSGEHRGIRQRRRLGCFCFGIVAIADIEPGILLPSICGRIDLPDAPVLVFQNVAHRLSSPRTKALRSSM
jgi:hypothetical protein